MSEAKTPHVQAATWTRTDAERDRSWQIDLSEDVARLLREPDNRKSNDGHPSNPFVAATLCALRQWGFARIEGLNTDGLASNEMALVAMRLGTMFGKLLPQTAAGDLVTHRREVGDCPMHTDGGDFAALLCVQAAARGGATRIVSSRAVYGHMLDRDQELVSLLFRDWHFDRRERPGPPTFQRPVYKYSGTELECFWLPNSARQVSRHGIALSDRQHAALDLMDEGTSAPHLLFELALRPGDVLLLDNRLTIHGREHFVNRGAQVRELVRVWILEDSSE